MIESEQKIKIEEQKVKDYDIQPQLERQPTETDKLPRDISPPLKVIEKIEESKSSKETEKASKPYQQRTDISISNIKLTDKPEEEKKVIHGQAVQRISMKDVGLIIYH